MKQCQLRDSYLNNQLSVRQTAAFKHHLALCVSCRKDVEDWQHILRSLNQWASVADHEPITWEQANALVRRARIDTTRRRLDIGVDKMLVAAAIGVSQRVLEMGFKEMLGISPQKFLRWRRMNSLRRDLRSASPEMGTVTDIVSRWGFKELGRTAVEYKQLFGESPSRTLSLDDHPHGMRFVDVLSTKSTARVTGSTHT